MTGPDPKKQLRELAREIRAVIKAERGLATPTILPSLGNWFAAAVYDYVRGKEPDLERALGLRRNRGRLRQGRDAKNYSRALKVFDLLRGTDGKPALTMDEILEMHFPDANKQDLEDEQERYGEEIRADIADKVAATINARLKRSKRSKRS
jgi:hypothetical protein